MLVSYTSDELDLVGFGWERANPKRILHSFVREHYRIHFITGGTGFLDVGEQRFRLTEGYGFIIHPGVSSNYFPDSENPWEYFWIGLSGSLFESLLEKTALSRAAPLFRITNTPQAAKHNLTQLFSSVIEPEAHEQNFAFYLTQLFENAVAVNRIRQGKSYYLEESLAYIHAHFAEDIHVSDLAAHFSIDRTYLYKLFRSNVGCSPQTYLIHHRVDRACDLLLSTDQSISEVAYAVGFNNLSDFSKQFRKRTGLSAKAYRQRAEMRGKPGDREYF